MHSSSLRVVRPYVGPASCEKCTGPKPLPARWAIHLVREDGLVRVCTDHVGKACADLTRITVDADSAP